MKPVNVNNKLLILAVLFLSLIAGIKCQQSGPDLPVDKIAKVYVDLLVAKELNRSNPDTVKILKKEIFNKYGIDSAFYATSIKNFKDDKKLWDKFFATAKAYLDSLKNDLTKPGSLKKIR